MEPGFVGRLLCSNSIFSSLVSPWGFFHRICRHTESFSPLVADISAAADSNSIHFTLTISLHSKELSNFYCLLLADLWENTCRISISTLRCPHSPLQHVAKALDVAFLRTSHSNAFLVDLRDERWGMVGILVHIYKFLYELKVVTKLSILSENQNRYLLDWWYELNLRSCTLDRKNMIHKVTWTENIIYSVHVLYLDIKLSSGNIRFMQFSPSNSPLRPTKRLKI